MRIINTIQARSRNPKLRRVLAIILAGCASVGAAADRTPTESDYYRLVTVPVPEGIVLEAGSLQMLPDGRLAAATRFGDIYLIEGALQDPPDQVRFTEFAAGLHEVLGLAYKDGWLYATQRPEITRMKDLDGDGRADLFETVNDDWGVSGDYHEYAFGSKFDPDGNLWVVLCLTGSFSSDVPWRGWCLRITPEGEMIPTSSGIRSPGGIGTNSLGDFFYTDNQGTWNGVDNLKQLVPGAFMGNPEGNKWYRLTDAMGTRPADPRSGGRSIDEAQRISELMLPAILFPYPKMGQSASGFIPDSTAGKFGPFATQLLVCDQAHSTLMRVFLEKERGRYQGACFMFRRGFAAGNLALEWAPDGSLFVQGTSRGWGSQGGKDFALQRVIWTGQVPFEIHEMRAKHDGFELTFTREIDPATAHDPAAYKMESYRYIYQSEYGSPEVDKQRLTIQSVTVAPDSRSLRLVVEGLREGAVHDLTLDQLRSADGLPLLHNAAYYTLNYIPAR